MLHHSPGSPRDTFASVEPNQKEYVGYYRLTIESTASSLAERRGKVLLSSPVCHKQKINADVDARAQARVGPGLATPLIYASIHL